MISFPLSQRSGQEIGVSMETLEVTPPRPMVDVTETIVVDTARTVRLYDEHSKWR